MFVRRAIDHYLKGKRSRRDVTRFLETHPDLDRPAAPSTAPDAGP